MAAGLIAIVGIFMSVIPLFTKYVVDVAIPQQRFDLAVRAMGLFLLLQGLRMVLWFRAQNLLLRIREDVIYAIRVQGFRHLQRLCMRFHGLYPSGYLHDRVFERSICSIGSFLALILSNLTVYASGLLFSLAACFYLSVPMTLLLLVCALVYVLVSRRMSPRIHQKSLAANEAHTQIHSFILDKLRGTKTVQALSLEEEVQKDFEARIEPTKVKWISAQREMLKLGFASEGVGYLITAAVHVVGIWAILRQDMPLGTLIAFIGYQGQFISFTVQLTNVYGQYSVARAGFDQLYTILDTHSSVVDEPSAALPASIRGELVLENVSFAYANRTVLRQLDLTIRPGQKIALVGRSGSGKTTITNLLMRFYDPDTGRITLDGTDIRLLPLRDYRAQFGVVLQDPYLFNDTVAANLRVVKPGASDATLWEALERACAADFVRQFPEGIDHEIGEAGSRLSGGQRQRLAIARCMLLEARLLVLDEATSALDNETEALVQRAMEALFVDRTAIIIAHRLSTIRKADRILVLDEGQLVEEGSFEELLAMNGLFHRLYTIATSSSLHRIKMDEAGFA